MAAKKTVDKPSVYLDDAQFVAVFAVPDGARLAKHVLRVPVMDAQGQVQRPMPDLTTDEGWAELRQLFDEARSAIAE